MDIAAEIGSLIPRTVQTKELSEPAGIMPIGTETASFWSFLLRSPLRTCKKKEILIISITKLCELIIFFRLHYLIPQTARRLEMVGSSKYWPHSQSHLLQHIQSLEEYARILWSHKIIRKKRCIFRYRKLCTEWLKHTIRTGTKINGGSKIFCMTCITSIYYFHH